MELESVLGVIQINRATAYELTSEAPDYHLQYITQEPFYISPTFYDVHLDLKTSSRNPKLVLVSAPGATGKSALAKYLAYKYQGIYWNLAKIRLGHNTFYGTIIRALGRDVFSRYMSGLISGESLLIIDALDEADLTSGREMLEVFLDDVCTQITASESPTIILLSRSATAKGIIDICKKHSLSIAHYEIGHFPIPTAKEFIKKKIALTKTKTSTIDFACADQYIDLLKEKMLSGGNVTENEFEEFVGYAPVLEAIAMHIEQVTNAAKLLSDLLSSADPASIIITILSNLLKREHDKLIEACKIAFADTTSDFVEWDKAYSAEEQAKYVMCYIVLGEVNFEYTPYEVVPPSIVFQYQENVKAFVPEHPFIYNSLLSHGTSGNDFTGPAFRDFITAKLILDPIMEEFVNAYISEPRGESFFPSWLFWEYYSRFSSGVIHSRHVSYLVESYRAKTTVEETAIFGIFEDENSEGYSQYSIDFGYQKKYTADKVRSFSLIEDNGGEIVFDQLINATIIVPHLRVVLGRGTRECKIFNSKIVAREIVFLSEKYTIDAANNSECILISNGAFVNPQGYQLRFNILNNAKFLVYSNNVERYHMLYKYSFKPEQRVSVDLLGYSYAIRSVLRDFRKDGKDTLGKYADKIKNHAVGGNLIQQNVFQYLSEKKIIRKEGNIDKLDMQLLSQLGISYDMIDKCIYDRFDIAYKDYCLWEKSR